jgi:16S rRNA (adenine1518-N6/adenine1519-N6)-dimethyltransferase
MNVKELLTKERIKPDRKMDQYFLDERYLRLEAGLAELNEKDVVLEIGAGPGNLTRILAEKSRVIAIEKDRRFMKLLSIIGNVKIINDDALKIMKTISGYNKIVSNIPYGSSQEILIEILKHRWDTAILIFQKEFAEKLIKKSKLSLIMEDCCEVEIKDNIPADAFWPAAVDSSIVVIKQKKILDEELWAFLQKLYRDKNRNAGKVIKDCPAELKDRKVHSLKLDEIKSIIRRLKAGTKGI